jgi:glycerol-3-phosphate acyltransferase PlsY
MEPLLVLFAALTGYLLGSISFAHVVARLVAPGKDFRHIKIQVPGQEETLESNMVSATTVRMNVGEKWGCLVSVLDMIKSALPMLAFKSWQPDQPYDLINGLMAVVGHNWPVYYRFHGGRGLSPILGNFLVLDWIGTLATNLAGFLLGIRSKNFLVITSMGIILMIPWIWFRTHDPLKLGFVFLCTSLYYYSMLPELKGYNRLRREGKLKAFLDARELRVVHSDGTVSETSVTVGSMLDRMKRIGRAKG